MKNKKRYIMLAVILMIGCAIIWICTREFDKELQFERKSVQYIRCEESGTESISINANGKNPKNLKLLKVEDLNSEINLDPAYWLREETIDTEQTQDKFQYVGSFEVPVIQGMSFSLHKIAYSYKGIEKIADIGRYEITYLKGQRLDESVLDAVEGNKKIKIEIHAEEYGKLVKAEIVNKDLSAKVTIDQRGNTCDVYLTSPSFHGYDELLTNMKYTFEKDGKQTVYYGSVLISLNEHKELNFTVHNGGFSPS